MANEIQSTHVDELSAEKLRSERLAQAIAKAKSAGIDNLYHLDAGDLGDVLFKVPDERQFHRATGKVAEDKSKAPQALKELALAIVVHPDLDSFRAMLAKFPGIAMKVANDAMAVASLEEADFAKKV
jgi:hypothetical protein